MLLELIEAEYKLTLNIEELQTIQSALRESEEEQAAELGRELIEQETLLYIF